MGQTEFQLVIGFLIPIIVGAVKKEAFSQMANAIIALVIYILAGAAWVLLSGQPIDLTNLVPTISAFVVEGTVAYQLFWKNLSATPTGLRLWHR